MDGGGHLEPGPVSFSALAAELPSAGDGLGPADGQLGYRFSGSVFGGIDSGGLGQDLLGQLRGSAVGVSRCVRGELGAIDRQQSRTQHTSPGAQRQHLAEQAGQRLGVRGPEPGEPAMCQQIPRRKPVNGFGIAGAKRHSLIRLASTAALVVLTVVGSAPPVQADPPTRIVLPPIAPPLLIPAGQGCAFDVLELRDDQNARIAITLFDARVMTNAEATPTFVNLETEASLDHHSTYTSVQTLDPTASTVHVEISGTIFIWLRPGNEGPSGTVEHPGAVLSVTGRQAFVYDIAADRIISYESSGSVTDLCEQLAA